MAAIITSRSISRAYPIAQRRLRLIAGATQRASDPASEQSPKTAVLACLTAGASGNIELLRMASAAAHEHDNEFYAVIGSSRARFRKMELRALVEDAVLASRLGAKILWLDSSEVVDGLLRLADQFRVGRIFILRRRPAPLSWLFGRTVHSGLLSRAKGVRVDVVPLERED